NGAGIVNGFRVGVADLQAKSGTGGIFGKAGLQRVIGRVRFIGDKALGAEASNGVAAGVELGERGELLCGTSVAVRPVGAREVDAGGRNVGGVEFEVAEVVVDSGGPTADVSVAEILGDTDDG